jgi:hypothetical protein
VIALPVDLEVVDEVNRQRRTILRVGRHLDIISRLSCYEHEREGGERPVHPASFFLLDRRW